MKQYEDQEILEHLEQIGVPVEESQFFVADEVETHIISDPGAVFIPRDLEGFIQNVESDRKIRNNYIHEAGHGAYFENTENGKRIRQLDSALHKLESDLFNGKFTGQIFTLPSDVDRSVEVNYEDISFLGIEDDYKKYYLVDNDLLDRYRSLRNSIISEYRNNLPRIEGFSLLLEEELGEEPEISKYPEPYIEGYRFLKPKKEELGWEAVVQTLS